ncbi:glycoside hydrolase family 31 protein [Olivibacter sp. CPCC 100613]|uniref:TIM-barrel domain-containing protein n=1 Tax=Olivibacter sp. CPCC 100613 TaxID=3079931 RepID=UPI002FF51555
MPKLRTLFTLFCCSIPFALSAQKANYKKTEHGISLTFSKALGAIDQQITIDFIRDGIVHVRSTPLLHSVKASEQLAITDTLRSKPGELLVKETNDYVYIKSKAINLAVSLYTGQINFLNLNGDTILCEAPRNTQTFASSAANGDAFYRIKQAFQISEQEGLYGLGQHQNGIMNYRGKQVTLLQYNTDVAVPMLLSTKNYGLLWNNYSITKVGDTRALLPLSGLTLYAKDGQEGWLSASYLNKADEKEVFAIQAESDIAYNDLTDIPKFPQGVDLSKSLVRYEGRFSSPFSGLHRLHFKYAGYIKVWIDGKLLQDRWRESWNAGSFELELATEAHRKHDIRIDWKPEGAQSYLGINWQRPIPPSDQRNFSFDSEAGDGVDYYFIQGSNMDQVISGYRTLTGKAPIMPKWVFGYWQSRERYKTQAEILDVAEEFRKRRIPIDNLVLDWSYWPEKDWGGQNFDTARFPDAAGMISQLHQDHFKLMISTWPKVNEESTVFNQFMKNGWLYRRNITDGRKDWIGKGYTSTFYDPFNADARRGFWDLLNERLYKKGVDAFWMDASEPDIHSNISVQERKDVFQPAIGSSTRYYNAFPLQNAKGIYEGQRAEDPNKRIFMLTRSGFAGQQRYAAATWSGDISSSWNDMKDQISAGLNFSMSGLPYWTMDVGGFLVEKRFYTPNTADQEEWRELNSRWYQFGAFVPIFRAHGQFPFREPFNIAPEGHPAYNSMVYYIQLRYRLLPYLYSLACKSYHDDYSMLRGLAMDFTNDAKTYEIGDQFMLGSALLVNPVTKKGATSRPVYLPSGFTWYDLYTGKPYKGGQQIDAEAPFERIPVFVKSGSILPIDPVRQYTDEKIEGLTTLYIFEGKNADLTLYEDDGLSYDYEKGIFNRIQIKYDNQTKSLTISERKGKYQATPKTRKFNIVLVDQQRPRGIDHQVKPNTSITYTGKNIKLKLTNN